MVGTAFSKNIHEIIRDINFYIIPIFNILRSKYSTIKYLKNNGTVFNDWTKNSSRPSEFLLYFARKETAEIFLRKYFETKDGIILKRNYNELLKKSIEKMDFSKNEFQWANTIKLAYKYGIKI